MYFIHKTSELSSPCFQHVECVFIAYVSTILESEYKAVKSCVGEGQISKPKFNYLIKIILVPKFSSYSHCKDQSGKSFFFRFAIVSLSV